MKKETTAKIVKTGIIVVLGAIAAYVIVKKVRQRIDEQKEEKITNDKVIDEPVSTFPLKVGSRGEEVKKLQQYLNQKLQEAYGRQATMLDVDGIFGAKTEDALKAVSGNTQVAKSEYEKI